MAASTISQSSSLAPVDFKVCTSFEDSNGAISVAIERCQLCSGSKRTFYCTNCLKKGHFTHSRTTASPERYN